MKIGEGKFYAKSQTLYVPKAITLALELEDGDTVEYSIENQVMQIKKGGKVEHLLRF